MSENSILTTNTKFYLQPKRNSGVAEYHTVQNSETMFSISESEGIKLSELYKKNLLKAGEEPAIGQKVYLKKKRQSPPELKIAEQESIQSQAVSTPSQTLSNQADAKTYTVQIGDSLLVLPNDLIFLLML